MRYLLLLLAVFLPVGPVHLAAAALPIVADEVPVRSAVVAKPSRRFPLKERIALSVVRRKLHRAERRRAAADPERPVSRTAVWSFVAGLTAFFTLAPGLNLFGASIFGAAGGAIASLLLVVSVPAAILLGILALARWKRVPNRRGKGFAIVGLVLGGLVGLFFGWILILIARY